MKQAEKGWTHQWLVMGMVALLSTGLYPLYSYLGGHLGFPLDDAWIHQTYARNLAQTGQLAYRPGQPSAGSTSPAWSFLLSLAYLVGLDYRLWAYLLGGLALAASAWLTRRLFLRLAPRRPQAALWTGLLVATEWHLVWAAASGMETMLFTALSLALLDYFWGYAAGPSAATGPVSLQTERTMVSAVGIGLLGGLLVVTRPEGLGLAALVAVAFLVVPGPTGRKMTRTRFLAAGALLAAFGLIAGPYVAFNLRTAGAVFPTTFYAKQTEYQISLALPVRFWQVLSPTLVGAQVLLLPGLGYGLYRLLRHILSHRNAAHGEPKRLEIVPALLPLGWWAALLVVYTLRLPVAYQHGRYVMPTIPLLLLYGSWGTAELLRPRSSQPWQRVLSRSVLAALILLVGWFWGRGAIAYRDEVGFIEGEMVAVAEWLNEHTDPGDWIAVHDIGAIGYFADRPLLDLAGLISPEVIPFMTDAERLMNWIAERGARYLVFFPDFSTTYRRLSTDPRLQVVYCTDHAWTRQQGHENMCVYRLTSIVP